MELYFYLLVVYVLVPIYLPGRWSVRVIFWYGTHLPSITCTHFQIAVAIISKTTTMQDPIYRSIFVCVYVHYKYV